MSASTTLITDANSMIATGPTTLTIAKAIASTGPIQDYVGNLYLYLRGLQQCNYLLGQLKNGTDASDPNLTTINNDLLTLS